MSLVSETGYKETDIGWIPSDWKSDQLGGYLRLLTGAPFKSEFFSSDNGIPLIRIRDLLRGSSETGYTADYEERYLIDAGDVLVAMDGEFHVVRWKGEQSLLNQRVLKISEKPGVSDEGFLFYLIAGAIGKIQAGISATTVKHLSTKDLLNLVAAIPPLPEQQKIAAILTALDDKLDVIDRQISASKTLKQGLMQTLFSRGVGMQDSDSRWEPHSTFKDSEQGKIPAKWVVTSIGEIGELKNGINKPKEAFGTGNQFVNLMDVFGKASIRNSAFGLVETTEKEREDFSLRKGDILFVRSSVKPNGVGITSLVEEDILNTVYSGFLIRLRISSEDLLPQYLKHYFLSDVFRTKLLTKSTISANTNINQTSLTSLPVICPSKAEQKYMAEAFDLLNAKVVTLTDKKAHYLTLKRGLMQKLLTGEWRVKLDSPTASV